MSVMLGVATAHGPASVANDVITRIAGLGTASTGGDMAIGNRHGLRVP